MGCTGAGLVAIVVLFVAVVLSAVSMILPAWSTSTITKATGTADFTAGVWGYCTNIDLHANSTDTGSDTGSSVSFDHCYFFHTSSEYELPDVIVNNEELMANFSQYSLCDGYDRATALGDSELAAYSQGLADVASLDAGQFDRFLDRSCGPLGTATLVFASLSIVAGVFAWIALVLGITCCKNKSAFIGFGKFLAGGAFVATLLTFIMWLAQAHPLTKKDDVGFSGSFILSVLAALLYAIVTTLAARHAKMGA
ncbi:hypothetical protein Gpo141_00004583 [Globisporangium polare]